MNQKSVFTFNIFNITKDHGLSKIRLTCPSCIPNPSYRGYACRRKRWRPWQLLVRKHWPTTKRCWIPWKSSRVEQWPWSILIHFWCWQPSQRFHRIISNILLIHLLSGCRQWWPIDANCWRKNTSQLLGGMRLGFAVTSAIADPSRGNAGKRRGDHELF